VVLTFGTTIVWGFGAAFITQQLHTWFRDGQERFIQEELLVLPDGTPVIYTCEDNGDGRETHYRRLDGARIKTPPGRSPGADRPQEASHARLASPRYQNVPFEELWWNQRLVCLYSAGDCPVSWYFLHDGELDGHGYFIGYDQKTRLCIGCIGRNGACDDAPPLEEQFPIDGRRMRSDSSLGPFLTNSYSTGTEDPYSYTDVILRNGGGIPPWTLYLLTDEGVVQVNVKERTTQFLHKGHEVISMATTFRDATTGSEPRTNDSNIPPLALLLRLPDQICVLDLSGKERHTYPLPAELRDVELQWIPLPGDMVLVRPGRHEAMDSNELFWINPQGEIVRHEKVALQKPTGDMRPVDKAVGVLLAPPLSLVACAIAYDPWSAAGCPKTTGYWTALGKALSDSDGWVALCCAPSVALACLCYRRQRKFGMPRTWPWVVFVLLLGLPGFWGYWLHRKWPARLPCPHCGRRAPRDRTACCACGQEFPTPALKGTEVFA
jgi:hypothetical protein